MRKHRFYLFVIAALAVVGFVCQGSAHAHIADPGPARLGIGDLTGSHSASTSSTAFLNGYSVALASMTIPVQQATPAQQAAQQQAAQQAQAAQQQQAAAQAAQQQQQQQQAAQQQQVAAQQQAAQQAQAAQQQQAAAQAAAQQQAAQQQATQATAAPSSLSDDFARLRQCESGGDYADNTGNGYYGAYQFSESTWQGLGYSGLPSDASPAQQDQAAQQLQAQRGWSPWPSCSAQLGLS
ncbi:MAG TPA: transglycosylase family protein [Acidimicrobiales bacterium]|nr:transglycosylase family protein [Acidimicrobiales bacterium]